MYLAQYSIGGSSWLQVAAAVTYPRSSNRERMTRWWERFGTLLRSLSAVPRVSTSLRIQLGSDFESALFAVAPESEVAALRAAIGSFTQLDVIADGAIGYSRERPEHDRLLRFPRYQCRVALPHLTRGSAWFAFDFRVHDFLNELLSEARALGHVLSYHLNVDPLHVEPEWQKQAAKNALRVSDVTGVSLPLATLQYELADKLGRATNIAEEFLGVETRTACDWLCGALTRRFHDTFGRYVIPEFHFDEHGNEGSLVATRHRVFFEPLGLDEICSGAETPDGRVRLLSWQPESELLELMSETADAVDAELPMRSDYTGMPQPYRGEQPYAFISYKREDLERIKPIVGAFGRRGNRIWYDRGIPGGAEWDAMIEERVRNCDVLLLFLSQRAVLSKYVRREVKFADTLNKPIVGIHLEPELDLSHGMGMLLNQYQLITSAANAAGDELDHAVRSLRQ